MRLAGRLGVRLAGRLGVRLRVCWKVHSGSVQEIKGLLKWLKWLKWLHECSYLNQKITKSEEIQSDELCSIDINLEKCITLI